MDYQEQAGRTARHNSALAEQGVPMVRRVEEVALAESAVEFQIRLPVEPPE